MKTDELITLEVAKLAKEKGFDYYSEYYFYPKDNRQGYNTWHKKLSFGKNSDTIESYYLAGFYKLVFPRPTQSMLQRWLREKHIILVNVKHHPHNQRFSFYISGKWSKEDSGILKSYDFHTYDSYEESLEKGLEEGLKMIETYGKSSI